MRIGFQDDVSTVAAIAAIWATLGDARPPIKVGTARASFSRAEHYFYVINKILPRHRKIYDFRFTILDWGAFGLAVVRWIIFSFHFLGTAPPLNSARKAERNAPQSKIENQKSKTNKAPPCTMEPLGWYLPESNWGHMDFQSIALPAELRHQACLEKRGKDKTTFYKQKDRFTIFKKMLPGQLDIRCRTSDF